MGIGDIISAISQLAGSAGFGILVDLGILLPQAQEQYDRFQSGQDDITTFMNNIQRDLGLPVGGDDNFGVHPLDLETGERLDPFVAGEDTSLGRVRSIAEEQIGSVKDFFGEEAVAGRFEEKFGGIQSDLAGLNTAFAAKSDKTLAGFNSILENARGLVSGLGDQERFDINERADASASAQQAALAARGLGGTTVTSSQAALSERERSGELGRLNERLIREQLGVEGTFGLAGLGFEERSSQFGAGLGVSVAGAQTDIAQFGFNAQDTAKQNQIRLLTELGLLPENFQLDLADFALRASPTLVPPQGFQSVTQPNFQAP